MDVVALASLVVGIIGTGFAIAVIMRNRQLARARLHLHVGWFSMTTLARKPNLQKLSAKGSLQTLIIGTDTTISRQAFAVCPVLLENATHLPIMDLRLQLEYPEHYLIDGAVIVDDGRETMAVLEPLQGPQHRTAFKVAERALVSYEIPILRSGEKVVISEVLHLKPLDNLVLPENSSNRQVMERLKSRFANVEDFLTVMPINISVYSRNCNPLAKDIFLTWLHATSLEQLLECSKRWVGALWDNKYPFPGIYFIPYIPSFIPLRWSRLVNQVHRALRQEQYAELRFLSTPIPESFQPRDAQKAAIEAEGCVIAYYLPPWGIMGESYDLHSLMGSPLRHRKAYK
jgi:hypothetical protein